MIDPNLLSSFIESLHSTTKLEPALKEIDRYLYGGNYHLNCMKTYEKGSEDWIYRLGEAGGSFRAAGEAMIELFHKLNKSDE